VVVVREFRRVYLVAFLLLAIAIVTPVIVRFALLSHELAIEIAYPGGRRRMITLSQMKRLPSLTRTGTYQNQFGNWRDEGVYTGVRLIDLVGTGAEYEAIRVVATDGYTIEVERRRVEDPDYPMILAYAYGGVEVPSWEMGFRIAVLPEDGTVSNEEYGVESAGNYWVKNVVRLVLRPH